jgi:3-oxoacyl-[acyl-carrier protein] reductase
MTESVTPVALLTGGSRGIGHAVAIRLLEQGYRLVIAARDEDALHGCVAKLQGRYPGAAIRAVPTDVSDEGAVKALFQQIQREEKRLDALVNAAGILLEAPLAMTRATELENLFRINVFGSYYCCQYAARLMSRQRSGAILNLASVVGEQGAAGQSAYAASKSAISGLTRSLARELAPMGIRVNAMAPGFIDTDMTRHYEGPMREQIINRTLLGRAGTVEDVAALAEYLLSSDASYVTGQVIAVDGGLRL